MEKPTAAVCPDYVPTRVHWVCPDLSTMRPIKKWLVSKLWRVLIDFDGIDLAPSPPVEYEWTSQDTDKLQSLFDKIYFMGPDNTKHFEAFIGSDILRHLYTYAVLDGQDVRLSSDGGFMCSIQGMPVYYSSQMHGIAIIPRRDS